MAPGKNAQVRGIRKNEVNLIELKITVLSVVIKRLWMYICV